MVCWASLDFSWVTWFSEFTCSKAHLVDEFGSGSRLPGAPVAPVAPAALVALAVSPVDEEGAVAGGDKGGDGVGRGLAHPEVAEQGPRGGGPIKFGEHPHLEWRA